MTASDLLFQRAEQFGRRVAIVDDRGEHSFDSLDRASMAIASSLLDGRDDLREARVALLVPPGFDYVAAQWAAWRAGGVVVPLAISHPSAELAYALDDATPEVVIAAPSLRDRIEPLARERRIRFRSTDDPTSGEAPLPSIAPSRRAMMIYTSGTTGRPKGVVTTHGNIRAQVTTLIGAWGWTEADRILHVLPLHHVHGIVNELCCALWIGATCEFAEFEPASTFERLASGSISVFMAVPTIYHRLIAAWDSADPDTKVRWSRGAAGLRLMVSGSAALPVATLARWREITGHVLLERYGMTEIGMGLGNPLVGERRAGTVGRPFPGVEARLVDDQGALVGPGTPGQIEIRGAQVFREYWNNPEATTAAFRDGWFQTGDVAQVEDGYYRILGRQSVDIIKSAGYKISALEIEEALRQHPDIVDCAVVGLADPDLGERVAAAVILKRGHLDRDLLRTWATDRLAPYKIPRDVKAVADLPRNAMGKVTKSLVRELWTLSRT